MESGSKNSRETYPGIRDLIKGSKAIIEAYPPDNADEYPPSMREFLTFALARRIAEHEIAAIGEQLTQDSQNNALVKKLQEMRELIEKIKEGQIEFRHMINFAQTGLKWEEIEEVADDLFIKSQLVTFGQGLAGELVEKKPTRKSFFNR